MLRQCRNHLRVLRALAGVMPAKGLVPTAKFSMSFLLKKITELRKFFKTCRFVESEEARGMLIYQIDNLKERWQSSDASEIPVVPQVPQGSGAIVGFRAPPPPA